MRAEGRTLLPAKGRFGLELKGRTWNAGLEPASPLKHEETRALSFHQSLNFPLIHATGNS